ncbi:uncharacterized protein CTRU02_213238 [Colletotrichum truncatum]|uniref:Uncharacterized protein n=1 Tax=Colletotrichum truncatum TaxID=5467 RepID=A0ACC3YK44_COLTU|nr:uncharacterized protein CTRU02_12616 [Colletotrichum truncatum]KAF6784354.1 hypothetical protein CTRU02_12616 [Colletotrichum truncatum]
MRTSQFPSLLASHLHRPRDLSNPGTGHWLAHLIKAPSSFVTFAPSVAPPDQTRSRRRSARCLQGCKPQQPTT